MSRRAQENIVAFLFLFFFVSMIIISFDYSYKARLVPVPILVISTIIMLLQMYFMNFKKDIDLNVDAAELLTGSKNKDSAKGKDKVDEVKIQKLKGGSELSAILIILFYLLLSFLIGILPAMFVFVIGFFIFITKMRWITSLIATLATVVTVYILFSYVLEIKFFEGWLVKMFLG